MIEIGRLTHASLKRISHLVARRANASEVGILVWVTPTGRASCARSGSQEATAIARDYQGYVVGCYAIGARAADVADDLVERLLELQPPEALPDGHISRRSAA